MFDIMTQVSGKVQTHPGEGAGRKARTTKGSVNPEAKARVGECARGAQAKTELGGARPNHMCWG